MILKARKQKQCKVCRDTFEAFRSTDVTCSPICGTAWEQAKERKKAKREFNREQKRRREALKTRSDWLKEAQKAFNAFVRVRDQGKTCISSGRPLNGSEGRITGSATDAGHYRSIGAAPHLRFNLWNCNAQSVRDNRELSGNAVEYRIRLIDRIGLERVEALESDNVIRKFDIGYLMRVKRIFSKRARLYKKLRASR